jgi:hypothetical protein
VLLCWQETCKTGFCDGRYSTLFVVGQCPQQPLFFILVNENYLRPAAAAKTTPLTKCISWYKAMCFRWYRFDDSSVSPVSERWDIFKFAPCVNCCWSKWVFLIKQHIKFLDPNIIFYDPIRRNIQKWKSTQHYKLVLEVNEIVWRNQYLQTQKKFPHKLNLLHLSFKA